MKKLRKLIREQVDIVLNESIYNLEIPNKENVFDSLGDLVLDGNVSQISFKSSLEDKQMSLFDDKKKSFAEKVKTGDSDEGVFKVVVSNEVGDYIYKIMFSGTYNLIFDKDENGSVLDKDLELKINPKDKIQVLCVNKETMEERLFTYSTKGLDHITDIVSNYFYDKF